jgi:hypothetical protein
MQQEFFLPRLPLALSLHSLALIAFQIELMHLLSITQWHHFAFMVISMAMLGFGASGTVLALMRTNVRQSSHLLIPFSMVVSGMLMSLTILATQKLIPFDSYLLFVEPLQLLKLLLNYLFLFLPLFVGAVAIGAAFISRTEQVGKLYFANLLGSGMGAGAALLAMSFVDPIQLAMVTGLVSVAGGTISSPKSLLRLVRIVVPTAVLIIVILAVTAPDPSYSQFKSFSRILNLPDVTLLRERPSPYGHLHLVKSPALRYAPNLSLAYTDAITDRAFLLNNGNLFGPINEWSQEDDFHVLDFTTDVLPYVFGDRKRVLILSAGTGTDVSHALHHGASSVVAVEPHRHALALLREVFPEQLRFYLDDPRVVLHATEPRTFLGRDTTNFDLVALPLLEAFGGTAGIFAVQEQYLLTQEAFQQLWHRLNPNGLIRASSWIDYPPRAPLRLLATLVELLEDEGMDQPVLHLAAVRNWGTITFLVKRSPFEPSELAAIRETSRRLLFDPTLLPDLHPSERMHFHHMADTTFLFLLDEILAGDRRQLYEEYRFNIRPATDNQPYFSQFLKWMNLSHFLDLYGQQVFPFLELGSLTIGITFVQISIAAIVLVAIPLFKRGRRAPLTSWTLLYFSGLGLGFMFYEIVLIQRFILYFGSPVIAAAVVIGLVLACSGVGSYLSSSFHPTRERLTLILAATGILLLGHFLITEALLQNTIGSPISVRTIITLLLIAPPAIAMGMPFPLGLRQLAATHQDSIAWAWSINGCASIISTALATLIALEVGFRTVSLLAAFAYAVTLIGTVALLSRGNSEEIERE